MDKMLGMSILRLKSKDRDKLPTATEEIYPKEEPKLENNSPKRDEFNKLLIIRDKPELLPDEADEFI